MFWNCWDEIGGIELMGWNWWDGIGGMELGDGISGMDLVEWK